jgi:flagellin
MAIVVNTNIASMNAQRSLAASNTELKTAMERLSTGSRINSASDDAAGFAIAESMTAQVRGLSMAAKNANDALGLLKVVENATNDVTDMLQRIRELAVQAQSGTNSAVDIGNLQQEANALIDEIVRVSEDTTYNGNAYIGSQASTIDIQVGYNDGDVIEINTYNVASTQLGVTIGEGNDATFYALKTVANNGDATYLDISGTPTEAVEGREAEDAVPAVVDENGVETSPAVEAIDAVAAVAAQPGALEVITGAIEQVASYKAEWGAGQNRLNYTVSNLMNVVEFTSAARSRIQDADFAVEAAKLAKAQVLQQTGTAMLAQANAAPQLALQLIK